MSRATGVKLSTQEGGEKKIFKRNKWQLGGSEGGTRALQMWPVKVFAHKDEGERKFHLAREQKHDG